MYEVYVHHMVARQVRAWPLGAADRFDQVVEAVAASPHAGALAGSDDVTRQPVRQWDFVAERGYGLVVYSVLYDPDRVLIEQAVRV